jgi:hypothetical protein
LDRRLGGFQSRSRRGDEEKKSQPQPELKTPIIQPITQLCTTEISRLLLPSIMLKGTDFTWNFSLNKNVVIV